MPRNPANGVSPQVFNAAKAFGLALAGGDRFPNIDNWNDVNIQHKVFSHRVDLAAITANTQIDFFNVAYSQFTSNLPQPKTIGGDAIFLLVAPRFKIERGYTVAGAATAAADFSQYSAVTYDADPINVAGDIATLYEHGLVNLRIGGIDVLKDQYGTYKFPSGGGPVVEGMVGQSGTSAAPAGGGITNTNNGVALASNRWEMAPFFWIGPNDQIECNLKYNFARTLAAALVGRFELDGYLISTN